MDSNGDGCLEFGAAATCPYGCADAFVCQLSPPPPPPPASGCSAFTIQLSAGTNATMIWFWPASGPAISTVAITSAGAVVSSPPYACSATLEYPGRWESWMAMPRTFPAGAPQATVTPTYPGLGTVSLCELPLGEAAWGIAHDGRCRH